MSISSNRARPLVPSLPQTPARKLSEHQLTGLFVLLLLLYVIASVWMAVRLPPNAAPNELLNYEYITVLRQTGALPNRGAVDIYRRYNEWHQPPFYFLVAAAVGLPVPAPQPDPNSTGNILYPSAPDAAFVEGVPPPLSVEANPFLTATRAGNRNPTVDMALSTDPLILPSRLGAALLGVVALVAFFWAGRTVYGGAVALLIASLMAFQPAYVHLSGAINNDMPLTAVAAFVLAVAVPYVMDDRTPRAHFWLGLACALGPLTKASGVFLLAVIPVVLLLKWRRKTAWQAVQSGLWAALGLIPLWAIWLVRNALLTRDTLGVSGSLPVSEVLLTNPLDFRLLLPELDRIWQSFWLDWSAGDIGYAPGWVYAVWLGLLAAGLLGWLRRRPDMRRPWAVSALFLLSAAAIAYLYLAVKTVTILGAGYMVPEGRWLLPLLPALAWFTGAGFARWWPPDWRQRAVLVAATVPPLSTFLLLALFLPALYPQVTWLDDVGAVPVSAESTPVTYDDTLTLHAVEAEPFVIGQESDVTLYWEAVAQPATNYVVSTQLVVPDRDGWIKLDEQNTYHGLGMNPSSTWPEGAVARDRVVLKPQGDLNGPTQAFVLVTLLDEDGRVVASQEPAIVWRGRVSSAETPPLPRSAELDTPVQFGDAIELVGVQVDGSDLILFWRARGAVGRDMTVFAQAYDPQQTLLGQADGIPDHGLSPTSIWQAGDLIRDRRTIDAPLTAGVQLLLGFYDAGTLERLPATANDERLPDDAYRFLIPAPAE